MKIIPHWPKATEHFILLALGWITFSALFGLFGAFDAMEASRENIAYQALIGALKTAGLMMAGGLLTLAILLFAAKRK